MSSEFLFDLINFIHYFYLCFKGVLLYNPPPTQFSRRMINTPLMFNTGPNNTLGGGKGALQYWGKGLDSKQLIATGAQREGS